MTFPSFASMQFYSQRCYRLHPILSLWSLALAIALLGALFLFAHLRYLVNNQQVEVHEAVKKVQFVREEKLRSDAANQPVVQLSHFESSSLVSMLNAVARETGVPIEEITYVLDEQGDQPFRRYQISFSTTSRYPLLRRMIQSLQSKISQLSLDGVSCVRDDIVVADLQCSLNLSAYFKKD